MGQIMGQPRTEAGRRLIALLAEYQSIADSDYPDAERRAAVTEAYRDSRETVRGMLPAIEREAAGSAGADPELLERIRDLQPKALDYIRRHGFIMDKVGPLPHNATELHRWKVLAFSLYCDLCEANTLAEQEIEARAQGGPSLDVERLARAIRPLGGVFATTDDREAARRIAAAYARLAPADPVEEFQPTDTRGRGGQP